jgi:hypothetical protein
MSIIKFISKNNSNKIVAMEIRWINEAALLTTGTLNHLSVK